MIGNFTNPFRLLAPGTTLSSSSMGSGLVSLLNVLLKTSIVVAGLYALINFIIAGYAFMSAGGDPKNITKAWEKIWQSLIGLLIIAGALLLGMVISYILFGDVRVISSPALYKP